MQRNDNLMQIVTARHASSRFTSGLNRRQQQRHQNANDGNDHQQLDQGETS